MDAQSASRRREHKKRRIILLLAALVLACAWLCLFVGSSHMTVRDCLLALLRRGTPSQNRILWNIRLPRLAAAVVAGAGLSAAGLVMQTTLHNPMASPSTLGVSNAAVFGANLSIIAFAGGFLSTGHNVDNFTAGADPYAAGGMAFLFASLSVLLILGLCRLRSFRAEVVVLAGIAVGSVWTAATTILQFYATDVGLSAAVIWTFGDLGRAVWRTDAIMALVNALGIAVFARLGWQYNALLSGEAAAASMGIAVERLRFVSLLMASLMTAVCVSYLGIIGFVGIICPQLVKRLLGADHRFALSASALAGSLLLLLADTLSRSLGNGSALPVGAVTSLLGAPFFLWLLFTKKEDGVC